MALINTLEIPKSHHAQNMRTIINMIQLRDKMLNNYNRIGC